MTERTTRSAPREPALPVGLEQAAGPGRRGPLSRLPDRIAGFTRRRRRPLAALWLLLLLMAGWGPLS